MTLNLLTTLRSLALGAVSGPPPGAVLGQATLDPVALVLEATLVVKLVILALVLMALACWYVIGAKFVRFRKVTRANDAFLQSFETAGAQRAYDYELLQEIHATATSLETSTMAQVFRAGYRELLRLARMGTPKVADVDNLHRAMRRAQNAEMTGLEERLPMLASTGSTAPFIGLFGTVWGIMNAFIHLHGAQSATLDAVAPGIAEALIATAIGLWAAIPAVLGYNYFVRKLRVVESETDAFASEYLNDVRRHLLAD